MLINEALDLWDRDCEGESREEVRVCIGELRFWGSIYQLHKTRE
jgi:hypothetical protein